MIVNNEIELEYEDNFIEMDKEDLKKIYKADLSSIFALRDEKENLLFTLLWQKIKRIFVILLDMKTLVLKNEDKSKKIYKNNDYSLDSFIDKKINNIKYHGYMFSYNLNGIKKEVMTLLFKYKRHIYSVNLYKDKNDDFDFKEFDNILNSLKKVK